MVIATDAHPIEPIVVDSFAFSPGERYDVVIHATSDLNIGYFYQHIFFVQFIFEIFFNQNFKYFQLKHF